MIEQKRVLIGSIVISFILHLRRLPLISFQAALETLLYVFLMIVQW